MKGAKGFDAKIVLIAVAVMTVFLAAGCNKQLTRIEQNQLRLQEMVASNAEQIAAVAAQMEQNREKLQAGIDNAVGSTEKSITKIADVGNKQAELRKIVEINDQEMAGTIAALMQTQNLLQAKTENIENIGRQRPTTSQSSPADKISCTRQSRPTVSSLLTGSPLSPRTSTNSRPGSKI